MAPLKHFCLKEFHNLCLRLEVGILESFLSLNTTQPELMELLGQEQFEKLRKIK